MDEPGFFSGKTVAIYGLGLMGGSLAAALKGKCKAVVGIARKPTVCEYALEHGFVDQAFTDPQLGLPQADVVVLAAPVNVILHMLEQLPDWHPGEAIVTDIGSTKGQIVEAMDQLPPRFSPIGGHPICGKEVLGIANAEPTLYRDAPYVFTPVPETKPAAKEFATALAEILGARLLWLSPEQHDRTLAATSHAPYLLSAALALATPTEFGPFTGSGFRSTARLAATPSSMMLDVLQSNQEYVLETMERVQDQLTAMIDVLKDNNGEDLQSILDESADQLAEILKKSK